MKKAVLSGTKSLDICKLSFNRRSLSPTTSTASNNPQLITRLSSGENSHLEGTTASELTLNIAKTNTNWLHGILAKTDFENVFF